MPKETISDKEGFNIIVLFMLGGSLALGTGRVAGADAWLAIFLAIILFIPFTLIYGRLLSLFPGKNLFDILEFLFGNLFGKLLSIVFIWFAFHIGTYSIRDMGEFTKIVSFPETPISVPIIIGILLCIWIVKEGIEVMGRWSSLLIIFNYISVVILVLLIIPRMEINNILPIMYKGIDPVLIAGSSIFASPFAESIVLLMVITSLTNKKSSYNIYIKGTIMTGFVLIIVTLVEVLVLGPDIFSTTYLPSHSTVSKIGFGNVLERLEVLVIMNVFIANFIKGSICILGVCKGITKLFRIDDYRYISLPVGLLVGNFALFIHESIIATYEWRLEIWRYYAFPIQVILPILILILCEIKIRGKKSGGITNG